MEHFWLGFEKRANPLLGTMLNVGKASLPWLKGVGQNVGKFMGNVTGVNQLRRGVGMAGRLNKMTPGANPGMYNKMQQYAGKQLLTGGAKMLGTGAVGAWGANKLLGSNQTPVQNNIYR